MGSASPTIFITGKYPLKGGLPFSSNDANILTGNIDQNMGVVTEQIKIVAWKMRLCRHSNQVSAR